MITDPEELKIIEKAIQPGVRYAKASRAAIKNILSDFFPNVVFEGKKFLELGPGHWDFAELARERGATTNGVDNDPAVVSLGKYKGFPVREANLEYIQAADYEHRFDGLFCKFSCNAFSFHGNQTKLTNRGSELADLLNPNGWAWVAPWNGPPAGLGGQKIQKILTLEIESFKKAGFIAIELSKADSLHYGVSGITENRPLYIKNLPIPERLCENCRL